MDTRTYTLEQLRDMPVGEWYAVASFDDHVMQEPAVIEVLGSGELLFGFINDDGILVEQTLSYDSDDIRVELKA